MLSWIEIDADRLRSNIEAFRPISRDASIMTIVKANAYGHGLDIVAPVAAEKSDWLGVNVIEEAQRIRALGIHKPVAILGHTSPDHAETIVQEEFRQALYRR